MLARLSIRDIVLIERLDIEFAKGLAVLTGETGAGKSILLDAFALALGGRGDAGLVRHGAEQGQVTAVFDVPRDHPATAILSANGLDDTGEMILRRVQFADGRTRAFVNDQTISVQTLKAVGSALVEIHGQHDERALVDAATHRRLLDAFAGLEKDVGALEALWDARRTANAALEEHRASMERAARDQLAGKEMDIGRYYMEKRDFTGAINRFKTVVTQYQTTRHVEEALYRLTEAYMAIGIVGEAQTAAAVLGHNFPDSRWYKDAYNLVKSGGLEPSENQGSWISRTFKKMGLG